MKPLSGSLLLIALSGFGCAGIESRVEERAASELRFDATVLERVELRIDDGRIEIVTGGDDGTLIARFEKRARATSRELARERLEAIQIEEHRNLPVLRLSARRSFEGARSFRGSVRTDVTLTVPRGLELDVRTGDGTISAHGIEGTLVAETADGRIRLSEVKGRVSARSGDGSILGEDLDGDFDVETDDGRVRLEGRFGALRAVTGDGSIRIACEAGTEPTGDWTIRTTDGSIELSLPASVSAGIDASTGDGSISNELAHFTGETSKRRVRGSVGAGGVLIVVTTLDGRITLVND